MNEEDAVDTERSNSAYLNPLLCLRWRSSFFLKLLTVVHLIYSSGSKIHSVITLRLKEYFLISSRTAWAWVLIKFTVLTPQLHCWWHFEKFIAWTVFKTCRYFKSFNQISSKSTHILCLIRISFIFLFVQHEFLFVPSEIHKTINYRGFSLIL